MGASLTYELQSCDEQLDLFGLGSGEPLDPGQEKALPVLKPRSEAKKSIQFMLKAAIRYGGVRDYVDLLDRVAALDQYKPYNALLVLLQRPSATFLLPAHQWMERYGRVSRPGQQPLVMLQPRGTPTLAPVPGVDLEAYKHQLIERFANPEIRDTLARLCAESSDRIPKWLLPVIRQQLASGGEIRRSALVVAAWARYAEGQDEQGQPIEVVDRLREQLIEAARRQHDEPLIFISDRDLFGDLIDNERFVLAYRSALDSLHTRGARGTLEAVGNPGLT